MTPKVWSKDRPTVEGTYWCRVVGRYAPFTIFVHADDDGNGLGFEMAEEDWVSVHDEEFSEAEWCGPIPVPGEAVGAFYVGDRVRVMGRGEGVIVKIDTTGRRSDRPYCVRLGEVLGNTCWCREVSLTLVP